MSEESKVAVKEALELIKALDLVAVTGIQIAEDGLGADDIVKAVNLLKDVNVIIEGVKGADKVVDLVKDPEQEDLVQMGMALWGLYKDVKAAASKKEA